MDKFQKRAFLVQFCAAMKDMFGAKDIVELLEGLDEGSFQLILEGAVDICDILTQSRHDSEDIRFMTKRFDLN